MGPSLTSTPGCLHERVVSRGPCPIHNPRGQEVCGMCCCFPACRGPASPPLPPPTRDVGLTPGTWGKPNCQVASTPIWAAGCPHASAFSVPAGSSRAQGPSRQRQKHYPPHLGLRAWSRVPGLLVFIPSAQAVLWARWPAISALRLLVTIPVRPSWTQPGQPWKEALVGGGGAGVALCLSSRSGPWPRTRRSLTPLLLFLTRE